MNRDDILKTQALEKKKTELYGKLVDVEIKEKVSKNVLGVKNIEKDRIISEINIINKMLSNVDSGKIEKVVGSGNMEK